MSEFISDVDHHHRQVNKQNVDVAACFPADFPYEFNLFGSSDSVTDSAKSSDDADFLAALTRDLARSLLCEPGKLAGVPKFNASEKIENTGALPLSPQSTLGGIGSWSGKSEGSSNGSSKGTSQATSPRAATAPFAVAGKKDSWDLIYETAGDVSGWRTSADGLSPPAINYQHGRGLPGYSSPMPSDVSSGRNPCSMFQTNDLLSRRIQFEQLKQDILLKQHLKLCSAKQELFCQQRKQFQQKYRNTQNRGEMCGDGAIRPLGLPQSAWPQLPNKQQQQHNNMSGSRAGFLGGSGGVKKECTGTGVFLPRQYNKPTETRKKLGCSTALLPARVVQALNLNFEDMNALTQPRFHGGFASDHDALLARRNGLMTQQKRSFSPEAALNHEISLPREWTY